jgi:putative FmdB family regulatory protein
MPIYEYQCKCGHIDQKYVKKIYSKSKMLCSKCGKWMKKIFSQVNTDIVDRPRFSSAMGVNISQIEQAKKAYPGSEYNYRGDLLVRNRQHKKQLMRQRGLIELD